MTLNHSRTELLSSLLRGYQRTNPASAKELLNEGVPYINPEGQFVNFKSIWLRDPGTKWTHYFTHGLISAKSLSDNVDSDYSGAAISSWSIPASHLSTWIFESTTTGFSPPNFSVSNLELKNEVSLSYEGLHKPNSLRSERLVRPVLEISLETKENHKLPMTAYYPITSLSKPTCRNASDLVGLELDYYGWSSNFTWANGILISCRDNRGRIENIYRTSPLDSRFGVSTSKNLNESNCRVSIIVETATSTISLVCSKSADNLWEFSLPQDAYSVSIIISDNLGLVIDSIESIPIEELWTNLFQRVHSSEVVKSIIEGESDYVEFKTWSIINNKKKAKDSILKAVVAFANSKGGSLFIGVSDSRELDGPLATLRSDGALNLLPDTLNMMNLIRTWLQEEIKPTVVVNIDVISSEGKAVVVVRVQEAETKPCCSGNGVFYVRDGASSRPGMRVDLAPMFR